MIFLILFSANDENNNSQNNLLKINSVQKVANVSDVPELLKESIQHFHQLLAFFFKVKSLKTLEMWEIFCVIIPIFITIRIILIF